MTAWCWPSKAHTESTRPATGHGAWTSNGHQMCSASTLLECRQAIHICRQRSKGAVLCMGAIARRAANSMKTLRACATAGPQPGCIHQLWSCPAGIPATPPDAISAAVPLVGSYVVCACVTVCFVMRGHGSARCCGMGESKRTRRRYVNAGSVLLYRATRRWRLRCLRVQIRVRGARGGERPRVFCDWPCACAYM